MISFENDYSEGASEKILQRLIETNMEQLSGYGNDRYCESAKEKIRKACGCPEAEIYFLSGGTQTNRIVISSMLQPYEGVIAAQTGHVSSHEAGAIESSGHKVLTLPQHDGKIEPEELADYLNDFYGDGNHEHMVFPGMVYISHPTEYGTLYTKGELAELADICLEYHIPLYLDGARLGYALAADTDDVKGCGGLLRCILHWRNKSRCIVWRGGCFHKRECSGTFPDPDQATGRSAGKGQTAWNPV